MCSKKLYDNKNPLNTKNESTTMMAPYINLKAGDSIDEYANLILSIELSAYRKLWPKITFEKLIHKIIVKIQ